MQAGTITVGLLIFDGVEVLDAGGPFEVFSTAGRLAPTEAGDPVARVVTIARSADVVVARHGLRIVPDRTIYDDEQFDVLVVPGGVVDAVVVDSEVTGWVAARHPSARLTLSICSGAFILAEAGLLDGRPATTHWAREEEMQQRWPSVEVRREPRWVDDGDIVSSAGISAGIDASLHAVRRLFGSELAELTAHRMEYEWQDPPVSGATR